MAEVAIVMLPEELKEHILLSLPIIDLIIAKCVHSEWLKIIAESPKIQQRLFQQPIPASDAPPISTWVSPKGKFSVQPVWVNPLLRNLFCICYSRTSDSTINLVPPGGRAPQPHGLLASDCLYQSWLRSRSLQQEMIFENVLETSEDSTLEDATARPVLRHERSFYRPNQSSFFTSSFVDWMPFDITENWFSMLARQPPLQTLRLRCERMGRGIDIQANHRSGRGGIVLGDIAEAATILCRNENRYHYYYYTVEMDIYQPLDLNEESNSLGFVNGNQLRTQEGVAYHRAWETKLQCHID